MPAKSCEEAGLLAFGVIEFHEGLQIIAIRGGREPDLESAQRPLGRPAKTLGGLFMCPFDGRFARCDGKVREQFAER